jgi:hypothetical protein
MHLPPESSRRTFSSGKMYSAKVYIVAVAFRQWFFPAGFVVIAFCFGEKNLPECASRGGVTERLAYKCSV